MTAAVALPTVLAPTGDPVPVERAVVDGICGDFEPETFLFIVFHRPDGGAHVWYAWTAGGQPLGDRIDQAALAAGLDAADWIHITDRHREDTTRGRIEIQAYPLRPIAAHVGCGHRAPACLRDALRRLIDDVRDSSGQPRRPADYHPRWLGVGPTLLRRSS